jgi:hypothetical protein
VSKRRGSAAWFGILVEVNVTLRLEPGLAAGVEWVDEPSRMTCISLRP